MSVDDVALRTHLDAVIEEIAAAEARRDATVLQAEVVELVCEVSAELLTYQATFCLKDLLETGGNAGWTWRDWGDGLLAAAGLMTLLEWRDAAIAEAGA